MKKLLILLSIFGFIGCALEKPVDENELPAGIMQPVEGTGAIAEGGFMPELQQSTMPENMK